ncbi:hypothetical protein pb186bvf_004867 [Paramecium bursaria]
MLLKHNSAPFESYRLQGSRSWFDNFEPQITDKSIWTQNQKRLIMRNYSTILQSGIFKFSLFTQMDSDVHNPILNLRPEIALMLGSIWLKGQFQIGTDRKAKISLINQQQAEISTEIGVKFNKNLQYEKLFLKLQLYNSVVKYDSNFGMKCQLQAQYLGFNPFIKFSQKLDYKPIIGLRKKIKSYELSLTQKLNSQSFNTSVILNLSDSWQVGFSIVVNSGYFCFQLLFRISRISFEVGIPLFVAKLDDRADGYITSIFGMLVSLSILKCLQQPKIKINESVEDRIRKSREIMGLIAKKARQNHKQEEQTNGLLIEQAYYGFSMDIKQLALQKNKPTYHLQNNLEIIDVTLSCIFYVKNSKLHLSSNSKQYLKGFCNPCNEDKEKSLLIIYSLKGVQQQKIFNDNEEVVIS